MRSIVAIGVAACLLLGAAPPVESQSNQLLQGTQVRLILLQGVTSSVAREGDKFAAVVAEPVYVGHQLVLPAGTRVLGEIGPVERPKRFAIFRGGASMNVRIRSIELDHREIPAPMSIVSIHETSAQNGRQRKDLRVHEGQMVEPKRDIKADAAAMGLSTSGGTVAGVIFGSVIRGLAIGLIGGTAYIVAKRGKEVELPAQTGLLVRLDSNVNLPAATAQSEPYASDRP
jgi:hypothetical protein